jgi:hypothetical protein
MCELFNSASVAAFVGALSAFLLVAATDLRRSYRLRTLLRHQVDDCRDLARRKIEAVQMNLAMIKEDRQIIDAPFMRFPIHGIKDYQLRVLDILNANQKQGVDAFIYWMEATDNAMAEVTRTATRIKDFEAFAPESPEKQVLVKMFIDGLEEAEKNLGYIAELAGGYVEGRPHEVLELYHPVGGGT